MNKRIAIFQYDWSMYGFIKDLAVKFVQAGYAVDIFFKDIDGSTHFADVGVFHKHPDIRFFDFTTRLTFRQKLAKKMRRLVNMLAIPLALNVSERPEDTIDPRILRQSQEHMAGLQYDCLIGIEKKGLVWAGLLSEQRDIPLVYYSLELYIEDHPRWSAFYHLRDSERRYHQRSLATIVQDAPRADALYKSNQVVSSRRLYFPVSVRGAAVRKKSDFFHRKFGLAKDKKILLYFGSLFGNRFTRQVIELAGRLADDMVLVVHGWGDAGHIRHLQSIADKEKVKFSLDLVPEDEIVNVIASADIGLALYATSNANDSLVAFSSAKMAHYSQCGIPVIAFETASFTRLMEGFRCGELIHSVDEVPDKVRLILLDYDEYRRQSFQAYQAHYDFDRNFEEFLRRFQETITQERT